MQARYQIHIRHDGKQYVASVPELEGCCGKGDTYVEALNAAEHAMTSWVFAAITAGRTVPKPSQDFVWRPPVRKLSNGPGSLVMQRLHNKFGNLHNRDLALKLGLTNVEPSSFSAAAAGQGARAVRVAIALTLGELPSKLWPGRSFTINERDDAAFDASGR